VPPEANVKVLICAIILAISLLTLVVKLTNSSKVEIIISGEETLVKEVPNLYTWDDVIVIAMASASAGASLTALIIPPLKGKGSSKSIKLTPNERKLYEIIIRNGGTILQSDLVKESGLPKSTVSSLLSKLEARGLIERRREGGSNLIVIKP